MFGRKKRAAEKVRRSILGHADALASDLNTAIYERAYESGLGLPELRRLLYDAGDDELAEITRGREIGALFSSGIDDRVRGIVRRQSRRMFEREMEQFGLSGRED